MAREHLRKTYHADGHIYRVTCIPTGRIYIGKTLVKWPVARWGRHIKDAKNGSQTYLHEEIRRYGVENFHFEVIATCLDKEALGELEYSLIREHGADIDGYNMAGPTIMHANAEMLRAIRAVGAMRVIEVLQALQADNFTIVKVS